MKSTDLISAFCRPVPFWSWNDKLEPDELRRQIGAMQDAGMGGFFMHARGGLETEYLSEDWFRAVEASVDEAKKRGMQAWCYDENGWPSGFAGGKHQELVCRDGVVALGGMPGFGEAGQVAQARREVDGDRLPAPVEA